MNGPYGRFYSCCFFQRRWPVAQVISLKMIQKGKIDERPKARRAKLCPDFLAVRLFGVYGRVWSDVASLASQEDDDGL